MATNISAQISELTDRDNTKMNCAAQFNTASPPAPEKDADRWKTDQSFPG